MPFIIIAIIVIIMIIIIPIIMITIPIMIIVMIMIMMILGNDNDNDNYVIPGVILMTKTTTTDKKVGKIYTFVVPLNKKNQIKKCIKMSISKLAYKCFCISRICETIALLD